MARHACPWWLGHLLASPLRRLLYSPEKILAPFVHEGMTVLEPGPGMGYFTLELARRVGNSGRVVAVDIQAKMLAGLKRRALKAGLLERLEIRLASPESLGVADLSGRIDFALAFAVVHEMPSAASFFTQTYDALKPGACLLFAEPTGHVNMSRFDKEIAAAGLAGLTVHSRPAIRHNHTALLKKPSP